MLDLPPRPKAEINAKPFEAPRCRDDDSPAAACLHDQLGQMEEAIVFEGLRMKGVGEFGRGVFPEGAEAKPVLQFGSMSSAILLRRGSHRWLPAARRSVRRQTRPRPPAAAHWSATAALDGGGSTASARSRDGCDRLGSAEPSQDPSRSACNSEPAHVAPWADRAAWRSGSRSIVGASVMLP